MRMLVWIGGIAIVIIGLVTLLGTGDANEDLAVTEPNDIYEERTADEAPVAASTNEVGTNDVARETADAANVDETAEGAADATEVATSDIGAASNAATDAAVEEIAEGNAPTSEDVVDESRDIAEAEGTVGAVAAYQADTFDASTVYEGLSSSDLDTTVQRELSAELDNALEEEDEAALEAALAEIREALDIEQR